MNTKLELKILWNSSMRKANYTSISQPPGRGPVMGPGINYTGPRGA